jgi:predicted TIM-barrel fold metal-dependent hydrolase
MSKQNMSRPLFTPSASTPVRYVDAHVHFWDQSEPGIDWPMLEPNFRFPLHRFNASGHYNAADHRIESAGIPVTKVVHVQAAVVDDPAVETAWLQRMADADPAGWPNGIVGSGTLWADDAPAMLERHAQYANFRGVRDPTLAEHLDDPAIDVAIAVMARLGAACDVGARLPRFEALGAVLDRHPDVTFVLNHGGTPSERTPDFLAQWRAGLTALARRQNLVCKVSGFALGDPEWTVESLRPMVNSCIDIFGVDRCLFASDWPVDKLHSTYEELFAAFVTITEGASAGERDALFAGTAERAYQL